MEPHTDPSSVRKSLDELLNQARAGDRDAENDLFDRLHARIVALAKRKVWDDEAAQDLAQETLQTAYEKYRSADFPRGFLPWVFTILHNKIGNYLKRRRIEIERGVLGGGELDWSTIRVNVDPEVGVIHFMESLKKALSRMTVDCRKVFRLLLAGAGRKEIQKAFANEPAGTTDSRVSRCRKKLLLELERLSA